jgi:putative (di)nucleoside polyphosphate hydrolase
MVDADGFRPNVGIVVANPAQTGQVLWARRIGGHDAWQFPQGGINDGESAEDALYRELYEEIGLAPDHVKILARTKGWLRYRLPRRMRRHNSTPGFVGQKQKWFLLEMQAPEDAISVTHADKPEFDGWRWVSFYFPLTQVIDFKRDVYRRALIELAPHLPAPNKRQTAGQSSNGGHTS